LPFADFTIPPAGGNFNQQYFPGKAQNSPAYFGRIYGILTKLLLERTLFLRFFLGGVLPVGFALA
jgi:hypothetical protein